MRLQSCELQNSLYDYILSLKTILWSYNGLSALNESYNKAVYHNAKWMVDGPNQ